MQPADIRSLTEAYQGIYEETVELTEELLDETFDELVDELIEEGYEEEEALSLLEDATDAYLEEAKVTFGHDTTARRASGAPVGARRKYGKRKAGEAMRAAGSAVKGAVDSAKKKASAVKAGAQIAGSIAKDEARRAGRKAALAVTSAPGKAKAAVDRKKQETKRGIKGFIKRQAEKVVKRMSEEVEALKATGLFSDKEIEAIMEADSLAAMQARREKRLAAQRKREGTTATGRDFGHDYSLTPAQQKARRDAEYKAGTKKDKKEEVEVAEQMPSPIDPIKHKAAQRTQKIYNKASGGAGSEKDFLKRTGPQLPGV